MKTKTAWSIVLLVVLFVGFYFYEGCKPIWQFDHLERNAKKVITPAELQWWATNLLAQYPTNGRLRLSELGTNFPQQLRTLTSPKLGPDISLYAITDTNYPRWIRLMWGSGFLGSHGFEIGPPNFESFRSGAQAWSPGVYYFDK